MSIAKTLPYTTYTVAYVSTLDYRATDKNDFIVNLRLVCRIHLVVVESLPLSLDFVNVVIVKAHICCQNAVYNDFSESGIFRDGLPFG